MNRNVMIVLAGGFLIAVLVALRVQASLSGGKDSEPVGSEPRVKIIVAAKNLKAGTRLNDENMKWQDWPESAVFPGAIQREDGKNPSELVEGRLLRDLKAGEPVVESALVPKNQTTYLAAFLDEDMRAVAISVNRRTMVAGFVGPGDYVDILLTYEREIHYRGVPVDVLNTLEQTINEYATETILQNVKVLAVDARVARSEEDKIKIGKTITVEVSPKDAEILALASEMGELSLALRRLGDEKIAKIENPVTTDARVTTIDDEVFEQIARSQDIASQKSKIVRIYKGNYVENIRVSP